MTTTNKPMPAPVAPANESIQPSVDLTPEIVKKYICPEADDKEIFFFLQLCKAQGLNPFLREAYLIKYSPKYPASIVVGKETFTKRAAKLPQYDGMKAGIIVLDNAKQITYREGALVIPGEELLGGWAEVYRKDWSHPIRAEVSIKEYMRCNQDGEPQRAWKEMPATMIRKVAIVQALREAFPEEFGGMYSPEEMPVDVTKLPEYSMDKPIEPIGQKIEPPKPKNPNLSPGTASSSPLPEVLPPLEPPSPPSPVNETPEEKEINFKQEKIRELLDELFDGNEQLAKAWLIQETSFTSKQTGKFIKGIDDIKKVKKIVSLNIMISKLEKALKEKRAKEGKEEVNQCGTCANFDYCDNAGLLEPEEVCDLWTERDSQG